MGESHRSSGLGYFPAVDGLRAVAILSVLIYHLRPGRLPGGFVGVDIFFVISGFVVTASVAHSRFDRLRDLLAYFYARRMVRILPALLVMLVATALLSLYFVPARQLNESVGTGAAAFLAASNILLAFSSQSYFWSGAELDPFLHTWTLGVEEQFYLAFPFFVYFGHRSLSDGPDDGRAIRPVAIAAFLSFALCAWLTFADHRHAFYQMPSRFWELGTGMILCLTIDRWRPLLAGLGGGASFMASAGSVILLGLALLWPKILPFPFPMAVLPVAASAALIAIVCARPDALAIRILSRPTVVGVGKLSYSLYLWHWPIFVLLRWTTGLHAWPLAALAVGLTFVSAWASYRFVEQPIRRRQRIRPIAFKRVLVGGILACLGGAALTGASLVARVEIAYRGERLNEAIPPAWNDCRLHIESTRFGHGRHRAWMPQCASPRAGKLVVVGDSHAETHKRLLRLYASDQRREVHLYFARGCDFPRLSTRIADTPECANFRGAVVEALATRLRRGDVLFMPSLRIARFGDRQARRSAAEQRAVYEEARAILRRLSATGARLILEAPPPIFRSPLYRCSDWFNRNNPACAGGFRTSRAEMAHLRDAPIHLMTRLAGDVGQIAIWDPLPTLCPGDPCTAVLAGQPLYHDGDHINRHANDLLYPSFRDYIGSVRESRG